MKWLPGLAGLLLLVLTPAGACGDGYCRNRQAAYYAPAYKAYAPPAYVAPGYAATYTSPAYDYTPVYQSAYLKTVAYPTNPDYYSSTESYYRDKVLLDAFAGKLGEALKKDREVQEQAALKEQVANLQRQLLYFQQGGLQPVPQAPPQPQYQPQAPPEQPPQQQRQPAMPRATGSLPPVPEGLQAVVTTSCIRCHGATAATAGGGYDFQNLAAVPGDLRYRMKADVDDGHMPKGGKPLDDKAAALFHQYATGRPGTATAQK